MKEQKLKFMSIRITPEQDKILDAKANAAGFRNKSEFVRSMIFMSQTTAEKIDALFEKLCNQNG